jgi:hypothetical protein
MHILLTDSVGYSMVNASFSYKSEKREQNEFTHHSPKEVSMYVTSLKLLSGPEKQTTVCVTQSSPAV